jgi:hypothetical protein
MNILRNPSRQELALVRALLQGKPETVHFIDTLDDLFVKQMNDGGMGSLSLVPRGLENASRLLGKQLVLGEFADSDGVPVSVAINVDSQGQLYELDVWKVDFAALLAWPDPANVRIVG